MLKVNSKWMPCHRRRNLRPSLMTSTMDVEIYVLLMVRTNVFLA